MSSAVIPSFLSSFRSLRLDPAQDFDEFLFGERYLRLPRGEIYPGVVELGSELYDGFLNNRYEAAFILAGLGSGKSTLAELLACAVAHWLICLPDPHGFFGLLPDKPLVIPAMGPTGEQVKRVVFAGIRSFIAGSSFFQSLEIEPRVEVREGRTQKEALKLSVTFSRYFDGEERDIVSILAGNSTETYPVGMNVFFSIVDEISKFRDDQRRSRAKQIFETLDQRRTSRFAEAPMKGMTICIGTAGAKDDYVDRKMREAETDPLTFTRRAVTWEMKGRGRYGGEAFHFAKVDRGPRGVCHEVIDEWPPEGVDISKVLLHLPDVPEEFRRPFERDPNLALRDFASIPSHALLPFDVRAEVVYDLVNLDREHPLVPGTLELQPWFKPESPEDLYYIHVDLALNKEGEGDVAGFVMGHQIGEKRVKVEDAGVSGEVIYEYLPIVSIDLQIRWEAESGREIHFSDVRRFIYKLRERGFNVGGKCLEWDKWSNPKPDKIIGGVSYDGWQSTDSIQILRDKGIYAFTFSVDKTTGPYEDLRECIHDRRHDFYRLMCLLPSGDKVPIFEYEYVKLERVQSPWSGRMKVDHPQGGSKDVADGHAAVVGRIMRDHRMSKGGFV